MNATRRPCAQGQFTHEEGAITTPKQQLRDTLLKLCDQCRKVNKEKTQSLKRQASTCIHLSKDYLVSSVNAYAVLTQTLSAFVLSDDESLDNIGVDVVKLDRKLALILKNARLGAFDVSSTVRWSRATMTVDTLDVRAAAAIAARSHTSHEAKGLDLIVGWACTVVVGALFAVGTLFAQVVSVAQLHLLDAVDFGLIVVFGWWIDALTTTIARNDFVSVHGLVCRRCGWGCWRRWSCCLRGPSTSSCGWLESGIMIRCQS